MKPQLELQRPSRPVVRRVRAMALTVMLGCAAGLGQSLPAQAFAAPESFADLADKISPAVVNITTSAVVEASTEDMPRLPEGSLL